MLLEPFQAAGYTFFLFIPFFEMNILKKIFGVRQEDCQPTPEDKKVCEARDFDILKYDGVKALKTNQVGYAVECFRHALDIREDLEIRDYLSQAYIATGDLPGAYSQLQKLAEAQPDNIDIFLRMAHVAYMMEDYAMMGSACEQALLVDQDSPAALYLCAKACAGKGNVADAVAKLTRAVLVKADYADAYLLRGELLLGDGRADEADEDAVHLLEEYPDNEDILMLKARIERTRGNGSVAIEYLNNAVDSNPFRADAYRLRGELRRAAGDDGGADADIAYAAELAAQQSGDGGENIEQKTRERYAQTGVF